jgi:hypothetical protein
MVLVDHVVPFIMERGGEFFEVSTEATVLSGIMLVVGLAVWKGALLLKDPTRDIQKKTLINALETQQNLILFFWYYAATKLLESYGTLILHRRDRKQHVCPSDAKIVLPKRQEAIDVIYLDKTTALVEEEPLYISSLSAYFRFFSLCHRVTNLAQEPAQKG